MIGRATERIRLVVPTAEHVDGLERLLNDEQVAPRLGGARTRDAIVGAVEREREHWAANGFGPWVGLDPATGEVIARGGLRRDVVRGVPEVELFYAVLPERWSEGLATELSAAAIALAFESLALPSIVGFTTTHNLASRRVLEKLGFVYEDEFVHANLPHTLFRLTATLHDLRRSAQA